MNPDEKDIRETIDVLRQVVQANSGWLGDERVKDRANAKILELIDALPVRAPKKGLVR